MNPLLLRSLPYLVGGAALVAGVLYYGHTRYRAGQDDVRAQWEAATQDAGTRFSEALQDQQTKLLKADAALLDARRATRNARETLDDALDTPEGAAWADVPLPDGVRVSLGAARHSSVPGDPAKPD